jgi:hypothetical protein
MLKIQEREDVTVAEAPKVGMKYMRKCLDDASECLSNAEKVRLRVSPGAPRGTGPGRDTYDVAQFVVMPKGMTMFLASALRGNDAAALVDRIERWGNSAEDG